MKRNILILLCVVIMVFGLTALTWDTRTSYQVFASSYTCEPTSRNPMHPCGPLRWGGNVNDPGMACPVAWRDRIMEVPGFGRLRCDDTPAQDYLYGLPHIDIRVSTVHQALQIGVQRMVIYSVDTAQPVPTPFPQPVLETISQNEAQESVSVISTPDPVAQSQDFVVTSDSDLAIQPEAVVVEPPAKESMSSQSFGETDTIKSNIYTVIANDTLSEIALRHNTTVNQLRTLNQIKDDLIIIGQKITLPTSQSEQQATEPAVTPSLEPIHTPESIHTPEPVPEKASIPKLAENQQMHTVQPGEWIYAIARQYGVTPSSLLKINNLNNPNLLQPGQQLIIPNQ